MTEHQHIRGRFVEAGLNLLAGGHDVATLTPDVVASYAELDRKKLLEEFPDHLEYLSAVRYRLQEVVKQDVVIATAGIKPGYKRLATALDVFLDSALRHPALRQLDLSLHTHLSKNKKHRAFINGFAKIFEMECKVLGVMHAQAHGKLFIAMTGCAHIAEHEARQPLQEFREVIRTYIKNLAS